MYKNLNSFKFAVGRELFVSPADNDYLLARWMLMNNFPEMFWHVSQAVEKYLKVALVLNGQSVSKGSHKLPELFETYRSVLGKAAFVQFDPPDGLDQSHWREEPVENFINKIWAFGQPDSRYGLLSWSRKRDDLFKIDQLCWRLRRTTIGLDWIVGSDFLCDPSCQDFQGKAYREALRRHRHALPRGTIKDLSDPLYHLGDSRGDLLHSWNFAYRRNDDDLDKPCPPSLVPPIGPMWNSHLFLFWKKLKSTTADGKLKPLNPVFVEGLNWLLKNVKLPSDAIQKFQEELVKERPTQGGL